LEAALIERLARLRGIGDAYHDYRGELRYFSLDTKAWILRAMGCSVDDAGALRAEISRLELAQRGALLPPLVAANGRRVGVELNIPARDFGGILAWTVHLETGEEQSGVLSSADCPETWRGEIEGRWITRRRFELPIELSPGYHELEVRIGGRVASRCSLVLSPPRCFEPKALRDGRRLWGVAVQLYTVRSKGNWGIGDFADLEALIRWLAPRGAGFIGLNPLHALEPADPQQASPYRASSRHFLNALYIAVPAVPEFTDSSDAQARVAESEFAERLREVRARPLVDYAGVAQLKLDILGILFREFCERHLAQRTARAQAYLDFVAAGGPSLQLHARFDALDRHFRAAGRDSGWLSWPPEFHDANGSAALGFAAQSAADVDFYIYLQWLAHEQLSCAQALARSLGMPIGLYGDYAVGAHPSGSEVWADPASYCLGAEIGAPPDALALKGQGWGIPPQDPAILTAQRLGGFMRLIRNNVQHYGALRLDHVMSLFRLWWVAAGHSPAQGAYVHYPLQQLLTVLALESLRGACVVIGEDLGVVPDEIRRAMAEFGLYHYKVLLFEKENGRFREPGEYPRPSLATASTHDLATLRSFWEGRDIELRRDLALYPSEEIESAVRRERDQDRVALLAALRQQGLNVPESPAQPFTPELAYALHVYLARSNAALVSIQIEDLLDMTDPVNVPGTAGEYPNWQRKLTADVEELAMRTDLDALFADISRARE